MSKKTIGITIIGDSIIRHKKNNVIYDWSAELKKEISKKFKFIFYFKVKSVVGINSKNLLKLLSKSFTKNKKKDRFENLEDSFFEDVYKGYIYQLNENKSRIKCIDSDCSKKEVCDQIKFILENKFKDFLL